MIRTDSFWELVERRAAETPHALFGLDESGRERTFLEYRDDSLRLAAGLAERGVREGTPVSWILPTGFLALDLIAALSWLGAVQNPILPIYRRREVEFCLRQTGAELLVVPREYRGFDYASLAKELANEIDGLAALVADPDLPVADPTGLAKPGASSPTETLRWIFYTSGTTADPKGARHTDATVLQPSFGLARAMDLRPEDRIAMVFPVTHLGGANSLVAALSSGCGHLIVEPFDPALTIPFLGANRVTHAGAGPVFHKAYLEAQRSAGSQSIFPSIRAFQGGGAQKNPQLHFDLQREIGGRGILSVYGMTECAIISLGRMGDADETLAHTEGRVNLPGTELRVLRDDGSPAAPGEDGEILLRAPQLCHGYVDASLDAAAFDEEGFFRSGDIGHVNADGFVSITGRLKDVIIRKGENISAIEIENLLALHPAVADIAVIGLPDDERGERCCAVVVPRDASAPLAFDAMVAFLRDQQLMLQKIPEQLEIVTELPRNPSGKVVKQKLRAQFEGTAA